MVTGTTHKRRKLEVIPWLTRVGGLCILYYLLVSGNVWFIPLAALTAYHVGRWAGLKIHGDTK